MHVTHPIPPHTITITAADGTSVSIILSMSKTMTDALMAGFANGSITTVTSDDGTMVADYAFPDKAACCPVLGPDLLFCVLYDEDSEKRLPIKTTRSSPSTRRRCSLSTGLGSRCLTMRVGLW